VTALAGLLVVAGAAVGAPARYLTDRWLQSTHGTGFPWGTFTVNVVASLALGTTVGATANPVLTALVGTGFCGALTTYSTFGYETFALLERRAPRPAVGNLLGSIVAGVAAAGLGWLLGRGLT
jgi:CrcB protein